MEIYDPNYICEWLVHLILPKFYDKLKTDEHTSKADFILKLNIIMAH